jgi:anaerobic selenocysteine-containing dehydrogenase
MSTLVKTNCPRDCYDACGILVEQRDSGKHRILGDPDHPISRGKLCSKCAIAYNDSWQSDQQRLLYPLKRIGPKGNQEFQRVTWDEALTIVCDQIKTAINTHGPSSLLHTHYSGTLSLTGYTFPSRFFNYLGATEVDPDTICNAAGHSAWSLLFGNSICGFDPRTIKSAHSILVWGANPSHSAPHVNQHWLGQFAGSTIVVDPIRTQTAIAADLHLQPRPGCDAALAFALLHCLQSNGDFDAKYIQSYTLGFEEITEHIRQADPVWGEKHTGVPSEKIKAAAKIYGEGPSMLWCGQGLQRQATGGNIMRSIGLLPALTGNIGKPGTGYYYLNITPAIAGIDFDWLQGNDLAPTEKQLISHMELAEELGDKDRFKVFFSWNTNPLASAPEQNKLRKNLKRDDLFVVASDIFMTDTCRYADIVLPASSFLEYDDLTFSYFNYYLGAQSKVSEPRGESLPNAEIFRRLAKKMNFDNASLFESDSSVIQCMMKQAGLNFSFRELQLRGYEYISNDVFIPNSDHTFDTPSQKIEIASEQAQAMGLPRVPQPWFEAPAGKGKFRLLSPASYWSMNDSYSNDKNIQKRSGEAKLIIHPDDAIKLDITDNTIVEISNATGAVRLTACIDDAVPLKTLVSYKGRWPSVEPSGGNVNFVHAANISDMGNSSSVHSTEVTLRVI